MDLGASISDNARFRIAYCVPVPAGAGTSDSSFLHQRLILEGLRSRRHQVTFVGLRGLSEVVTSAGGEQPAAVARTWSAAAWFKFSSRLAWRAQQWVRLPYLNVFSNLETYDACLRCLPGHDIVQERNGLYKMGVAMACRRRHIPFVYFFDADDVLEHDLFGEPLRGILRWRAKQVLRYNLASADRVVCLSRYAKDRLVNAWKVPESKIAVFPNCVDVERFRQHPEARSELRDQLGIQDGPAIVFVGSLFPYQDITVLLKAFALVSREFPGARLLVAGGQQEELEHRATEAGIAGATHFLGFQTHDAIPRLLAAGDIAVAPYRKFDEGKFLGSSMKVFEYMAAGLAVIATGIGQIRDIIQDGRNGVLVPPEEPQALAAALRKLIDDAELRGRLGIQARRDAETRYSHGQYLARLEMLYGSVLHRSRGAAAQEVEQPDRPV